jgi:hypothetical protein
MTKASEKSTACFFIAPIGADGSDVRLRSDQVLKHIVGPATKECGYETIRADQISEPGIITSQVIQHVVEDPLVIADLTGRNPNVFYELAIRHATKKPVVQIIHGTEAIPFDVAASRTIHFDHHDLDSAAKAREEIVKQIRSAEKNPKDVDTPITVALELQQLRQSDNPLEKSNAEIITMLQEMRAMMVDMRELPRRPRIHPGVVEELAMLVDNLQSLLDIEDVKTMPKEALEDMRMRLHHLDRLLRHLCVDAGIPHGVVSRRLGPRERFRPAKSEEG